MYVKVILPNNQIKQKSVRYQRYNQNPSIKRQTIQWPLAVPIIINDYITTLEKLCKN